MNAVLLVDHPAFLLERVDMLYRKSKAWADLDPAIVDLPSSNVPGRVYGCFFDDNYGLHNIEAVGVDNVCFETDYPHSDSALPRTNSTTPLKRRRSFSLPASTAPARPPRRPSWRTG